VLDAETADLLRRGVVALERIADHLAPIETQRERKPATLSTAKYTREEREREEVRATLRGEKPLPKG
jgi:hypothetical protein